MTTFEQGVARLVGRDRVRANQPLAPFTTFGVGGPADWLADVRSIDELTELLAAAAAAGVPVTLLGGGSNIVVADAGIRGLVIRLQLSLIESSSDDVVRAQAGVTINGLVRWTVGRGLAGLEAWAGTPGTVGGAIHGNAHWAGRNVGGLVRSVVLASAAGVLTTVPASDMGFGYDRSRVQQTHEVVVSAEFAVSRGVPDDLRRIARASLAFRKRTQPLALPSAGCVFQNPDPGLDAVPAGVPVSAGALVDRAGLKGFRIGGARISETHANFVVNDGTATATDIRALVTVARRAVQRDFGVTLRDEVVYLGDWDRETGGVTGHGG